MEHWTVDELISEFESYEGDRRLAIILPGGTKEFGFVIDDSDDVIKLIIE